MMKDRVAPSLYGLALFIDLDGVTARHLMQLRPHIVMNIVHSWQGCYPIRLRSINFINAPKYVHIGVAIFKSFMNEKMRQRLHVYSRDETVMHKYFKDIPVNIRPIEYGGTNGTVQEMIGNYDNYKQNRAIAYVCIWYTMLVENREWFLLSNKRLLHFFCI